MMTTSNATSKRYKKITIMTKLLLVIIILLLCGYTIQRMRTSRPAESPSGTQTAVEPGRPIDQTPDETASYHPSSKRIQDWFLKENGAASLSEGIGFIPKYHEVSEIKILEGWEHRPRNFLSEVFAEDGMVDLERNGSDLSEKIGKRDCGKDHRELLAKKGIRVIVVHYRDIKSETKYNDRYLLVGDRVFRMDGFAGGGLELPGFLVDTDSDSVPELCMRSWTMFSGSPGSVTTGNMLTFSEQAPVLWSINGVLSEENGRLVAAPSIRTEGFERLSNLLPPNDGQKDTSSKPIEPIKKSTPTAHLSFSNGKWRVDWPEGTDEESKWNVNIGKVSPLAIIPPEAEKLKELK